MAKLIVREGPSKQTDYELTDEVKVVGRDRTNDVRINHALVSRNHAQFFKSGDGYAIRDLESKNGTFVNNAPLTPGVARPLVPGDQVRIGPTTFEFALDDGEAAAIAAGTGSGAAVPVAAAPEAPPADSGEKDAGPATRILELNRPLFEHIKASSSVDDLRVGHRQLWVMLEVTKALAHAADARAVHQALLGAVHDHLSPQRTFLFRMSENNSALVLVGQDLAPGESPGQPLLAARLAVAQSIRDKAGVIRTGMMSAEQTGGGAENRLQLAAPLMNEGNLLGVIYIDAREQVRPYRMNELRLLAGLAQLTADFLARADSRGAGGGPSFSGAALDQMRREAGLIGNSAGVGQMRAFAAKSAAGTAPVLLYGPPGAGKGHLTRLMHLSGARAAGPLVTVHGPAMAKSMTEADIFGQEIEGAAPQIGRVEWAQGGTLFIDQLAEVSLAAQERLFQVISKSQFVRVGSDQMRPVDCRVVVSTNSDPKEFVGHRLFYQPLIQALGEALYEVPSLAARKDDIPALAEHFLEKARTKADRKLLGFSDPALHALSAYNWPGNLGELNLAVHYAVFHGKGREVTPDDLPDTVLGRAGGNGRQGR